MKGVVLILAAVLILGILGYFFIQQNSSFPKTIENPVSNQTNSQTKEGSSKVEVVAKNLAVPWSLAFLPDGSIIVTERGGTVKKIAPGDAKTITTIPVKQVGEGGLHGVAIHPDFDKNRYIYFYYTYSEDGGNTLNKVVRYQYNEIKLAAACLENDPNCKTGETPRLTESQTIVDKIPGATFHDGGKIKFGPDKLLYITTGDAQNPSLAQDKNSLAGKILTVEEPSLKLVLKREAVYSYGHRNPQGITWDSQGNLWEVEHGQTATDEINLIEYGKNYGWPEIRGDQKRGGMESPVLHSGSDTWAPAGAVYYKGSIYFGGLRGQALYQYVIDTKELKTHFKGEFGRIREVILGPDNMLYITTSNRDGRGNPKSDDDKIIRVNPELL